LLASGLAVADVDPYFNLRASSSNALELPARPPIAAIRHRRREQRRPLADAADAGTTRASRSSRLLDSTR